MDDLLKTGSADNLRINVEQKLEVVYRPYNFGVNAASLKAAVTPVGPMLKYEEKHFGK